MQGKQVLGPKDWTLAHVNRDKRAEPAALSCVQSPCYCSTQAPELGRHVERDKARLWHSHTTQLLCKGLSPCGSLQVPKLYRSYQAMTASLVNHVSHIWESQFHAATLAITAGELVDGPHVQL